jgi:hypothetical protein
MVLLTLACNSSVVEYPDTDSPDSYVDTSAPVSPWLDAVPTWTSESGGVATGAGFGDIDGDGDADLIIAYGNDIQRGPIAVYRNVAGRLETEASWTSASLHYYGHLSVGDVDGDGWVDVVASRFIGDGGFDEPGGVHVFLNNQGTLSSTPDWSAEGFYSFSNALGDVDNDGDLDLAVAVGEAYYNDPDRTRVYVNDGAGQFGDDAAWTSSRDRHTFDVAWADFDDDGQLDLAMANAQSPHCVYFNAGGELAASPGWSAAGDDSSFEGNTLDWGDVTGDGAIDLVISDNLQLGGSGLITLYCGPDLHACWQSGDTPRYQSAVSLEDVDADGDLDLFAGAWGTPPGFGDPVRMFENTDGALETEPSWTSVSSSVIEAFAWADLDGSDWEQVEVSGVGLVQLPAHARPVSVQGGVVGDGWLSGPGPVSATVLVSSRRDLAVSNWDKDIGNHLYER